MRSSRLGRLLAALFTATLLLLAACGDDDGTAASGGDSNGADEGGDDGETSGEDEESDDSTTTTAADTTTTEAEPDVAAGAECLIGTWTVDNDAWGESFQSMIPADTPMQLEGIGGTVRVEFGADGTVANTYEDWTINAAVTQPAGTMTITRAGVDTGTYTAGDDGSFSMTGGESGSTVSAEMNVGGQVMSMPSTDGLQTNVMGGAGTYECEGDRMSIDTVDATIWLDRVG